MDLEPQDITPDVCQRCAKCCSTRIEVRGDHRQLEFHQVMFPGRIFFTKREPCPCGCGGEAFEGYVEQICPRLTETDDGRKICNDYENRPEFCRRYNCVIWAMVNAHGDTDYTLAAKKAIEELRRGTPAT